MCMNSCLVKKQGTEFGAIQGRSFPHPQMQLTLKKKKKEAVGGWIPKLIQVKRNLTVLIRHLAMAYESLLIILVI